MSDCRQPSCLFRELLPDEVEAMIKRLARAGAQEALKEIGLSDEDAGEDVRSLRDILKDWRSIKKNMLAQLGRYLGFLLLAWFAFKLGLSDFFKPTIPK